MTTYDAVLFDNDGVLVEPPSRETQVAAARDAFSSVGVERVADRHLDAVVSGPSTDTLREVCAAYDLDVERFWTARERHDERSQLDAFETGARTRYEDVRAIADLPGPSGVVSNNHQTTVEFVLDFFDLADAFDTVHGRPMTVESLDRKKPDPHYLGAALDRLDAESALYVGDSESDVLAAERAGLDSVFVRRAHNRDEALATDPTYETADLHDVVDVATE